MMSVWAWVLYCLTIAGVVTAAALAWERSARWSGAAARWGWVAALGGSVLLPWLLRLVPGERFAGLLAAGVPVLALEPMQALEAAGGPAAWSALDIARLGWILGSAAALVVVALLFVRLDRARRGWRTMELDGGTVSVAPDMGPAAVGIRRGAVVIPVWALELEEGLRSLLLRHEREHVRAGDPRLLLGGLLLVAAMPWNPFLWLQFVRLRNAIELDCDARVLGAGASPRRYGMLLLEVGRRRSGHSLVMATFTEPRLLFEQRIRRIAGWPLRRHPLRATSLGVLAMLLFAAALGARDPLRAGGVAAGTGGDGTGLPTAPAPFASDTPPARRSLEDGPTFTPMTERPELLDRPAVQRALVRNYPPLLRDAGISGTPTVWFFIDAEGSVARALLSATSGYEALDSAALRVARGMRFKPARHEGRAVPVWVEIPIVFTARDEDPPVPPAPSDPPPPPPARPAPPPPPAGAPTAPPRVGRPAPPADTLPPPVATLAPPADTPPPPAD